MRLLFSLLSRFKPFRDFPCMIVSRSLPHLRLPSFGRLLLLSLRFLRWHVQKARRFERLPAGAVAGCCTHSHELLLFMRKPNASQLFDGFSYVHKKPAGD